MPPLYKKEQIKILIAVKENTIVGYYQVFILSFSSFLLKKILTLNWRLIDVLQLYKETLYIITVNNDNILSEHLDALSILKWLFL